MKTLWRIFKYGIFPLILAIAIALIYISVGFSKLEFRDNFDVTDNYSSFYQENYILAKETFRIQSYRMSEIYENVMFREIGIPSMVDDDLTLGLCYIPAQKEKKNLIILISGVHGVEGLVGHAAQELFVKQFLSEDLIQNTGVLLLHSINPFGFKYARRVTENNVDLNRNSPSTEDLFCTINEGYPKVYDLINPKGKVKTTSLANRFFFVKAINEIRKASLPVLRQAVLQGQYKFPQGLYFGGHNPDPQIDSLRPIIKSVSQPYQKIMAVDFHTGYGERGRLHFFPNPLEGEAKEKLEKLYEGFPIDWGDSDDFYTVTGDFASFIGNIIGDKEFYPMVFEYGTLNSQTTMGSMKSIHIMILENQGNQYGFASPKDSIKVKNNLLEMYFPKSENWRNYVLEQTHEVFSRVLPRFVDE